MENSTDYISLRKYKNNEDDLLDLLSAGIARETSIYVHSTESEKFITLSSSQIQEIISKHPEKANIHMGFSLGMSIFSKHRGELVKHHYQLVNYVDLWINKDEADLIVKKPLTYGKASASETEKSTMLKIMLGMAISAYQYNPLSDRNSATGSDKDSIEHDLKKCGLKVNNDTIRKHLDEARKRFKHVLIKNGNKMFIDK